jgi:hypothetical protein
MEDAGKLSSSGPRTLHSPSCILVPVQADRAEKNSTYAKLDQTLMAPTADIRG